mmetsp:Transcript_4983/g.14110  ORF Transcript_4983/g.14110 Transcript_4983/m.14110 type:complete len:221 (-) Transcript_4983:1040-1702(-)
MTMSPGRNSCSESSARGCSSKASRPSVLLPSAQSTSTRPVVRTTRIVISCRSPSTRSPCRVRFARCRGSRCALPSPTPSSLSASVQALRLTLTTSPYWNACSSNAWRNSTLAFGMRSGGTPSGRRSKGLKASHSTSKAMISMAVSSATRSALLSSRPFGKTSGHALILQRSSRNLRVRFTYCPGNSTGSCWDVRSQFSQHASNMRGPMLAPSNVPSWSPR